LDGVSRGLDVFGVAAHLPRSSGAFGHRSIVSFALDRLGRLCLGRSPRGRPSFSPFLTFSPGLDRIPDERHFLSPSSTHIVMMLLDY
jgi:hypothetical protein